MSLVTPVEVRALVETSLTDPELQAVIDREEQGLVDRFGAHYSAGPPIATATETIEGEGKRKLYLRRRLTAVTSVTENDVALAATDYKIWGAQGTVERLPRGLRWGEEIAIVYTPANDNDTRKGVIIDLVRLALERTALKSESIAGEYSYSAPEWEAERTAIMQRLALPAF